MQCIVMHRSAKSDPFRIHLPTFLATPTHSCACRISTVRLSKNVPRPSVFAILTSKSLSRASVAQILRSSTSKTVPTLCVFFFYDFDFHIALACRRGAVFDKFCFKNCSDIFFFDSRAQAWCHLSWKKQKHK